MARSPKPKKSNVIPLTGVSYAILATPEEAVVKMCRDLLKRAEKGELIGLAVAYVEGGNRINVNWECGRAGNHSMVSAIRSLDHLFLKEWHE